MRMPEPGEGSYICEKCQEIIFFPIEQNGQIVKPENSFHKPVCPKCGGRKFKRDIRVMY